MATTLTKLVFWKEKKPKKGGNVAHYKLHCLDHRFHDQMPLLRPLSLTTVVNEELKVNTTVDKTRLT